jgi:hypothetical protein
MPGFNPKDWIECSKIWVADFSPDQFNLWAVGDHPPQPDYNRVVYFYAAYPADDPRTKDYPNVGKPHDWTTVDVSSYVPPEAKAVFLSGVLIITHGRNPETAELQIYFRRDDTQDKGKNYIHQVVLNQLGKPNGQRCCASVIVPLTAQKTFQWKWEVHKDAILYRHEEYSAYQCNLRVGAVFG